MPTRYYGRRSKKEGYDWIVGINADGCFITDPIEDWEKDNDYLDEAQANTALYERLDETQAASLLALWERSPL